MNKNLKGNLLLILAAMIWGVSFVMQDKAGEILPAFSINGIRSLIGTASLMPLMLFRAKKSGRPIWEELLTLYWILWIIVLGSIKLWRFLVSQI